MKWFSPNFKPKSKIALIGHLHCSTPNTIFQHVLSGLEVQATKKKKKYLKRIELNSEGY